MSGGGSNTTTEKADPWMGAQPFMMTGMNQALANLQNGPSPRTALTQGAINAYAGAGTNPAFQQALGQTQNWAGQGYGQGYQNSLAAMDQLGQRGTMNDQAFGAASGLAQNGATDPNAMWTLSALSRDGSTDAGAMQALRGLGAQGSSDAQGMDVLRRTAAGEFAQEGNPYFQRVVDQNIQAARPSIDAAFASSGRLGSGASAAAFADAALRQSNELGYQNYQQERGYQNSAANALLAQGNADAGFRSGIQQAILQQGNQNAGFRGQMAGAVLGQGNQDASTRLNAANMLSGMTQQDFASRMGALQNVAAGFKGNADFQAQAAGQLPSYGMYGAENLGKAAGLEGADISRMDPWTQLNNYWGVIGSAGGMGQGRTSTSPGVDNTGAYVGMGLSAAATVAAVI